MSEDAAVAAGKPRKSEVIWRWAAIIAVSVLVLLLLGKVLPINWLTLVAAVAVFVFILWWSTREEKVWHVTDSIKLCKDVERELTGISFVDEPDKCLSHWNGANHTILFLDPRHPTQYIVDPMKRVVLSRRPLSLYRAEREAEKSKITSSAIMDSIRKNREKDELGKLGFDTEDDDESE